MKRLMVAIILGMLVSSSVSPTHALDLSNPLPDRIELEKYGLVRHWHTQIPCLARETLLTLEYSDGVVFAQTDQGMMHCLDAESGQVNWSIKVNQLNREVHAPAITSDYVYVTTGDDLIQVDRKTGRFQWTKTMPHAIVASPAATADHVFVNCSDNSIYAIALNDEFNRKFSKRPVDWFYNTGGPMDNPPVVFDQWVAFSTVEGTLYTSTVNERKLYYRFFAYSTIPAPIASLDKMIYIATGDFNLFAMDIRTGAIQWRFRTGYPIKTKPMPFVDEVFVVPQGMGLYCLNNSNGKEKWLNPIVKQLVAVSEKNVYAADEKDLLVLSREDGHLEGALEMRAFSLAAHNQATDRIFMATPAGLILSLHESQYAEPYQHPKVEGEKPKYDEKKEDKDVKRNFFGEIIESPKAEGDMTPGETKPGEEPAKKAPTLKFFD